MRQAILFIVLVMPGIFCFVFCMYFAPQDYAKTMRRSKRLTQFARVADEVAAGWKLMS